MWLRGSVRARLLRLALLLVLPCLGISALLTWRVFVTARQGADAALLATAHGLDQLLDREFLQAEVLLRTLTATDELRGGHVAELDRLARAAALPGTAIVLLDPSGRVLVDTARPAGTRGAALPVAGWAREVPGQASVSSLVSQRAAGVLSARVVLPVGIAGRHAYDLEVVMPAAVLQRLLLRNPLPQGWTSTIMDAAGIVVASTRGPDQAGRRADTAIAALLGGVAEAVRDGSAPDGTPVLVGLSRSEHSHWAVAVAVPSALIGEAGRQSTLLLAKLGSGAVVLGLLGALVVARGIAKPIEAMAKAARGLGEGGTWTSIPQGLTEADAVARAMFGAFEFLVERREQLGALNATLTTRVIARTTELASANAALDDQSRQIDAILDHTPVGVVVHGVDGQVQVANREARRLLGLPMQGELNARMWPVMRRGNAVPKPEEEPWARARAGQPVERELLTLQRPGQPPVELEVNASPLLGQDGEVSLALTTLQDVTARLEAEESRRRSQRLEAVGQLTGGVAHEFNNLLMAISGCLELLSPHVESTFGQGSRARTLLANAARATGRGAGLTGQLLAFARRQHLQVEPVDLNAMVAGMSQLLEGTLGRLVAVEVLADRSVWPAMADAAQLELVLLNLAINARDAMPGGGKLTIRTANIRTGLPSRPEDPPEGEHAVLAVSDTGHGMQPHVLARVFEPFFTTKDVGRGSGLGLPHVLGVAQQLGGGVRIASAPGQGTTVSLYLPRAHAPVAASRPAPPPRPGANALAGARILLVDDDTDVREIARSMLEEMGAVVFEAENGAQALLELRTQRIDLVLADLTMPQMSGVELADAVAALQPAVPVVLMTGYGPSAVGDPGGNVRATLRKPFRAEALARALAAQLGLAEV